MSLLLDLIRFLAAFIVILHHAAWFNIHIPLSFARTGTDPVIVFFVLSGLVIAYTAETKDHLLYDFVLSRAARLLSVAIPAIILTIALDQVGSFLSPDSYRDASTDPLMLANLRTPPPFRIFTSAIFANQIWWLDTWPGTNSPFWSMGFEVPYYILFCFAFYLRGLPRLCLTFVVLVAIGPKVLLLFPVWLLGVLLSRTYRRVRLGPKLGAVMTLGAVLGYTLFLLSGARDWLNSTGPSIASFGLASWFASDYIIACLFGLALIGLNGLEPFVAPICTRLAIFIRPAAACTFSMYLYHYPLLHFFDVLSSAAPLPFNHGFMRILFFFCGVSLSIWTLAKWTEQKKSELRRHLQRLFDSLRSTSALASPKG